MGAPANRRVSPELRRGGPAPRSAGDPAVTESEVAQKVAPLPEPPALAVLPAWWGRELECSAEQLDRWVVEVLGELADWPTLRAQRPRRLLVLRRVSSRERGFVYAALDVRVGRVVALKFSRVPDDDREPRLLANLAHPHVLLVHDVVHAEPYVGALLEWADTDLDRLPRKQSWSWVLGRLLEVGEALVHIHARGIVHGDVKPENILLCDDVAKLGDFGTARPETESGAVSGTPMYMPPERWRGIWCVEGDVYSWCRSALDLLEWRQPPAPPRLLAILNQGLSTRPELRPSMRELLERLAEFRRAATRPGLLRRSWVRIHRAVAGLLRRRQRRAGVLALLTRPTPTRSSIIADTDSRPRASRPIR